MNHLGSTIIGLALLAGAGATLVGLLAPWWPAADLLNHFRPFEAAGSGLLLVLSLAFGFRTLAIGSACLFVLTLTLLLGALRFQAPRASTGRPRLKVVTLNTWTEKGQADRIVRFVEQTQPDIVFLR